MKHWLQTRSLREQLLVTLLVVAAALVWVFAAYDRVVARVADWKSSRQNLVVQQSWLSREGDINARAAEAIKNLDPARTLDASKLVATITTLATQTGLQPQIDTPQINQAEQFSYHTVRVTLRRTTLASMLNFYDELTKQVPYLNLESVNLQTDRANVGQLSATLQISSTQISQAK